jgi:hypothetical protein
MSSVSDIKPNFSLLYYHYPITTIITPWIANRLFWYYKGHTICVAEYNNNVYLGIAKCRFTDPFTKKIGRKIALGRAEKAYNNVDHSDYVEWKDKNQTIHLYMVAESFYLYQTLPPLDMAQCLYYINTKQNKQEEIKNEYKILKTQGMCINNDDTHWIVNCPSCGKEYEYTGFFDPEDITKCDCGVSFVTEKLYVDDKHYII